MTEGKNKLFVKVRCRAYMKKWNDGVHIAVFDEKGEAVFDRGNTFRRNEKLIAYGRDPNSIEGIVLADLSSCEGESVSKVYRKRVEENFTGFVVGYTTLKCEGVIGTDTNDNPYIAEHGYCFRSTTYAPKVAIVYFKNNAKRYVLLEDMEVIE